jgi:maltooligosyltrehalose trehalohydrolase
MLQARYERGTKDSDILETADLDVETKARLLELAGPGTDLSKRHGLYVEFVASGLPRSRHRDCSRLQSPIFCGKSPNLAVTLAHTHTGGGPMPLLPMMLLGAHEGPAGVLTFGLYLPNVTTASGVTLGLKIIHEADQFLQGIQPLPFALANTPNPAFPGGDYWTVTVDTTVPPPVALPLSSKWGTKGTYVYRYVATPPGKTPIDFIIDPYAREYGVGDLSAITVGFQDHAWSANEATWKTPPLKDMIFYELMISEFGFDIRQAIPMLSYLKDLGINCIEVMPVNDVKNTINWGYDPIGYFGVSERFGNRADFQRFVDAAHQCGLAVVLDAVYGHTTSDFVFPSLYPQLGIANPFNGPVIRDDGYGPKPDFSQPFVQDYFFSINQLWLDKFHLDGFRYDNVPAFWDPAAPAAGYGALVLATLNLVSANLTPPGGAVNYWNRFQSAGVPPTLVQCAEYLNDPTPDVLNKTVTNCTGRTRHSALPTTVRTVALAQSRSLARGSVFPVTQ